VFFFSRHAYWKKELIRTGKRVGSQKAHIPRRIVYSDLEAKTESENCGKVFLAENNAGRCNNLYRHMEILRDFS
jgi:hypothetical protein